MNNSIEIRYGQTEKDILSVEINGEVFLPESTVKKVFANKATTDKLFNDSIDKIMRRVYFFGISIVILVIILIIKK